MKIKTLAGALAVLCSSAFAYAEEIAVPIADCDNYLPKLVIYEEIPDLEHLLEEGKSRSRLPPAGKGEVHVVLVPKNAKNLTIEEKERDSRIAEDLTTLRKIIFQVADSKPKGAAFLKNGSVERRDCVKYVQKYERATVNVKTYSGGKEPDGEHQFIAGPSENFYLSADLPISNIKQLTFDEKSSSLVEKEKPASFYVGLNYKFGDIFTNYPYDKFYRDVSAKFMIKAASKATQSLGFGLAYSLKEAEIFVARVWTKDDSSVGGEKLGTTQATVFGLSFNLTKGLGWITGDKK